MATFKEAKNNTFVNIVLPIIILVLGLLFAILPWVLPNGFIFTFLAFLLVILAIVAMVLSLKSTRKDLSIIALIMSIVFFVGSLSGAGHVGLKQIIKNPRNININLTAKANEYIDENYKFAWTEEQFKELKIESMTLQEVLDAHGKGTDAEWGDDSKTETLDLTYAQKGSDNFVRLSFNKGKDGIYILAHASADFGNGKIENE
jgi:hypothetical protein